MPDAKGKSKDEVAILKDCNAAVTLEVDGKSAFRVLRVDQIAVSPGEHTITVGFNSAYYVSTGTGTSYTPKTSTVRFAAKAGQTYYVSWYTGSLDVVDKNGTVVSF